MFAAIDIGLDADAFWRMSPRAILLLRERVKEARGIGGKKKAARMDVRGPRLSFIPH